MLRRRRGNTKLRDPYKSDQCQKCGKLAIPPTAARYCEEHMPTERICMNCDAKFPWRLTGPGLCLSCKKVDNEIMKEHMDPVTGALIGEWSAGDHLRELAKRTKHLV